MTFNFHQYFDSDSGENADSTEEDNNSLNPLEMAEIISRLILAALLIPVS